MKLIFINMVKNNHIKLPQKYPLSRCVWAEKKLSASRTPWSRLRIREIVFSTECFALDEFLVKRPVSCPKILQLTIG